MTLFSVVIPAYNQAQYLASATQSALDQTDRDFEVIVVDDGSTDGTPEVAAGFGPGIRYISQSNQGLAAARNTGIHHAIGTYVALLDADDVWCPTFLETMRGMIKHHPTADVFYCAAQCIDANGTDLPQLTGAHAFPPERFYDTLLRANSLIPSTMVLRRSILINAGSFDSSNRALNGCEDWDLWLRLARTHRFIGTDACLVRYRLHSASLSSGVANMQRAARTMVEKHFGPDDSHPDGWSADKRRAYGGLYRYNALTSMLRAGDWQTCAEQCRQALLADPTLAADMGLFYELALGTQPLGGRGTTEGLDPAANAVEVERLLRRVFNPPLPKGMANVRTAVCGTAFTALARVAWLAGDQGLSRNCLLRAARYRARMTVSPTWWRGLLRTFVPRRMIPLQPARSANTKSR